MSRIFCVPPSIMVPRVFIGGHGGLRFCVRDHGSGLIARSCPSVKGVKGFVVVSGRGSRVSAMVKWVVSDVGAVLM